MSVDPDTRARSRPAWPWPALLWLPPLAAVLGGLLTVYLAVRHADVVLPHDPDRPPAAVGR
ncbi:MAG: hypothetical protein KatS3mg121_1323 [Gammaproteobacteria bacterium]|nr:MAG: hypothetical protein KatS3mg121_1323 [Gammaproteobacteria bacterium]